jgi:3-oxoacyl-[acyl-carrier-protein] synthase II
MSLSIAGMGWVTPLGSGIDPVWQRLLAGDEARAEDVFGESSDQSYKAFRVPNSALAGLQPHPRLRRVSAISRFAAAAGLEALANAGVQPNAQIAERIALVFAISNGGVVYTKRFYSDIVESGAQAASPLLFPETVFNAPASHLAALLGVSGATYTLVGDGAVGLLAIRMAEDLMLKNDELEYCLVVGAEEVDWLLCDAYRRWRLLRASPPLEPFSENARGMILSEGAGAVLLTRNAPIQIDKTFPASPYHSRAKAKEVLKSVLVDLTEDEPGFVVASANGTFIDEAEAGAIREVMPDALVYTMKPALGESVGAGGIWQVIVAALVLQQGQVPPVLYSPPKRPVRLSDQITPWTGHQAIALTCGLAQQAAGVRLRRGD